MLRETRETDERGLEFVLESDRVQDLSSLRFPCSWASFLVSQILQMSNRIKEQHFITHG